MELLSLFTVAVFAAETILSPLADDAATALISTVPSVSFGQLTAAPASPPQILGAATDVPESLRVPGKTTPKPQRTKKSSYIIALLGDSMIDTLGPDAPHLKSKLAAAYPGVSFQIFNYGVGGTNIDYGLERITSNYQYLGQDIPALVSKHPDIVVVESFGYNPYPFDNGAIDKHWLALAAIVDKLKAHLPGVKIIIAATIAPDAKTFGDGAAGLSFSPDDKWKRVDVIKKYLESTVKFAASQHLPIADAFHSSLGADGNGKKAYINQGDHIHYSDAGRNLFADAVMKAVTTNRLLE
ncbi:SGNH/GDSL hydrolase family protein [Candidatus Gottesmanbacteria bacterium]|nr:SGNH/GDSL hydrolase family protein [Candidatus Gottesmanbacteria bacterium]